MNFQLILLKASNVAWSGCSQDFLGVKVPPAQTYPLQILPYIIN